MHRLKTNIVSTRRVRNTGASLLILLAMAAAGCHSEPSANDIPPGAIPQPCGTYVCKWNHAETARADQVNFVIYLYEWSAEPAKLTPHGQDHLDCLSARLVQAACPVVIETSHDDKLDAARREEIVKALAAKNVLMAAERVVIGRPEAEGLYGQEAPGIAAGMLGGQAGGGGGGATGGGGGATGATGGGSFGGGSTGGGLY
jgi:uncharacterized membrane protein YgcG